MTTREEVKRLSREGTSWLGVIPHDIVNHLVMKYLGEWHFDQKIDAVTMNSSGWPIVSFQQSPGHFSGIRFLDGSFLSLPLHYGHTQLRLDVTETYLYIVDFKTIYIVDILRKSLISHFSISDRRGIFRFNYLYYSIDGLLVSRMDLTTMEKKSATYPDTSCVIHRVVGQEDQILLQGEIVERLSHPRLNSYCQFVQCGPKQWAFHDQENTIYYL